jgi:DNA-directed RNA polymerase
MNPEFILNAENKSAFTAFCLVMRELNKDPNYLVKLPIFLDATCSGVQHLAAIAQDLDLAQHVNLVPQSDNDKVSDIYAYLTDPINETIRAEGIANPIYSSLKFVKLERSDVKQPIMTKTYNVTVLGIKEQLAKRFKRTSKD